VKGYEKTPATSLYSCFLKLIYFISRSREHPFTTYPFRVFDAASVDHPVVLPDGFSSDFSLNIGKYSA